MVWAPGGGGRDEPAAPREFGAVGGRTPRREPPSRKVLAGTRAEVARSLAEGYAFAA